MCFQLHLRTITIGALPLSYRPPRGHGGSRTHISYLVGVGRIELPSRGPKPRVIPFHYTP